jgi:hypothetical protein
VPGADEERAALENEIDATGQIGGATFETAARRRKMKSGRARMFSERTFSLTDR